MTEISYKTTRKEKDELTLDNYTRIKELEELRNEIKLNYNEIKIELIKKTKDGFMILLKTFLKDGYEIKKIDNWYLFFTTDNLLEILETYFS